MNRKSLTHKTLRNGAFSLMSFVWPIFLALVITPTVILQLGVKNYGIYLFVGTVISLLGLLDIGLGMSITKHISYEHGREDKKSLSKLISTSNSLFIIIAFVGLLLSFIIYRFGPDILPENFSEYKKYSILFLIGGFIFFIDSISRTYNAILVGLQDFEFLSKIGIISSTAFSIITLIITLTNKELVLIFITQLIINSVMGVVVFLQAKRIEESTTLKLGWDTGHIINSLKFASITFFNNVASSALSYLDKIIIPFYAGPSNLTYYNMPGTASSKITGISGSLTAFMFPLTSQLKGEGNEDKIKNLYIRSFRIILMISGAFTITLISYSHEVLLIWLNSDFAEKSTNILIILSVTNFLLALWRPLSDFLFGLGKLKILSMSSITMSLLNIVLLIVLLPKFGILGAAWAYLLSIIPIIGVFYYTEEKILGLENRVSYHMRNLVGTLLIFVILWFINENILSRFVTNLFTLGICGLTSILLYIVFYRIFGLLENEDLNDIKHFMYKVLKIK